MINQIVVKFFGSAWVAYAPGYWGSCSNRDRLTAVGELVDVMLLSGVKLANSVEIVRK